MRGNEYERSFAMVIVPGAICKYKCSERQECQPFLSFSHPFSFSLSTQNIAALHVILLIYRGISTLICLFIVHDFIIVHGRF